MIAAVTVGRMLGGLPQIVTKDPLAIATSMERKRSITASIVVEQVTSEPNTTSIVMGTEVDRSTNTSMLVDQVNSFAKKIKPLTLQQMPVVS